MEVIDSLWPNTCIASELITDGIFDSPKKTDWTCDNEHADLSYSQRDILFQTLCKGFSDIPLLTITHQSMTDEIDCQH